MFKKILIFLLILGAFFSFQNVFAYDDKTTHPALTEEIVNFYNLSFPDKQLTSQQKEWIIEGSILEDTPPRWINHFYDPINKVGWTGEEAGKISVSFIQFFSRFALSLEKPLSAVEWANNKAIQQEYSRYGGNRAWKKALEYFADGNQEEAYKTLGYILHLLEDMSVPDHTRNDTHAQEVSAITGDEGSPYEQYASRYTRQNIKKEFNIANSLKKENQSSVIKSTVEDYLISLATYSNKYFFSKDTINDKYQYPKIIRDDGNFGYGLDENGKEFLLVKVDKVWNLNKLNYDSRYILEKNEPIYYSILNTYFSHLFRQSVLHGAGVINLFNKQAEDAVVNKEYPVHLVEFRVDKLIPPTFSLIGELSRAKEAVVSFFSQVKSTIGNLLGINQSQQPQQISLLDNTVDNVDSDEIAMPSIIETNNSTEIKNEILDYNSLLPIGSDLLYEEGIKKGEIKNQEKQQEEIVINVNEQSNQTSGQTNTIVFKYVGGSVSAGGNSDISSSGNNSGGGSPQTYPKILITEIQLSPTSNRFIELYNPNNSAVNLTDWYIHRKTQTGSVFNSLVSKTYFENKTIGANDYFLISRETMGDADIILNSLTLTDSNTIQFKNPNGEIVDKVGWGEASDCEGNCAANPTEGQSIQREFQNNAFLDANNNAQDFGIQTCPSPNAQSASCQIAESEPEPELESELEPEPEQEPEQNNSTSTSVNLVISEIQVKGDGADDEFIELYNPTDNVISLSDYSIQYLTGTATSTVKIESNGDKRNFSNGAQIAAKSFYLLANTGATSTIKDRADMTYSVFSLSGSSNGATIFLVSSSTYISDINDQTIIDSLSYGSPMLTVSTANSTVPDNNQSLERKAFATSTIDLMVSGEHRFSGNGYDTDSADDFILRNSAEPQNSQNFSEPRNAPITPQNFSIQYSSSTMELNFNWNVSQDYFGATSTIIYKISDISNSSSTFAEINTTSTSASISINEVGRDYNFSIQAFDAEGLGSATSTTSISIPSFLTSFYFYKDPRDVNSTTNFLDFYWNNYPFVPPKIDYGNEGSWRVLIFYLNKDAEKTPIFENQGWGTAVTNAVKLNYQNCAGSYTVGTALILPDVSGRCSSGYGGVRNQTLRWSDLEDNHLLVVLDNSQPLPNNGDYLTAAFYAYGGNNDQKLVAVDKTKYYFQTEVPVHQAPTAPSVSFVSYDSVSKELIFSWPNTTDSDSLDNSLSYKFSFSSSTNFNFWVPTNSYSYLQPQQVKIQMSVGEQVAIKTVDEFDNSSIIKIITLQDSGDGNFSLNVSDSGFQVLDLQEINLAQQPIDSSIIVHFLPAGGNPPVTQHFTPETSGYISKVELKGVHHSYEVSFRAKIKKDSDVLAVSDNFFSTNDSLPDPLVFTFGHTPFIEANAEYSIIIERVYEGAGYVDFYGSSFEGANPSFYENGESLYYKIYGFTN